MYTKKDFLFMNVNDINGKKIGFVNDLLIDFNEKKVNGFSITPYNLFEKSLFVSKEQILSFNKSMIVKGVSKGEKLHYNDIKGMNVVDKKGNIIGMVENIIFQEETFFMYGLIVSTGYINNFIFGKRIISIKDIIVGEKDILVYKNIDKFQLISTPHNILREESENEKIK